MSKIIVLFVLSSLLALTMAEPRLQQLRQQQRQLQHPFVFLSVPKGRTNAGAIVGGFEIVDQDQDDVDSMDDDHDDDDVAAAIDNIDDADNDDEDTDDDDDDVAIEKPAGLGLAFARNGQIVVLNELSDNIQQAVNDEDDDDDDDDVVDIKQHDDAEDAPLNDDVTVLLAKHRPERLTRNGGAAQTVKTAKPTHMMVARDQAGAIMVPDGIIEIEGQSVIDEKTGKSALLVPRAALDAIPDGSVVALMERSTLARNADGLPVDQLSEAEEEERANRVIVRRRRKGSRRNVRRRRRPNVQRRRRPSGQRRRRRRPSGNRRRNVRVVRPTNMRRRRAGQRRRPVVLQG